MAQPNPYRDPVPWNRVRIGGRLITSILTAFNGMKIEDGWKVDKSKSSSGGAAKFTGTKLLESIKLTFKAAGPGPNTLQAAIDAFDDMIQIYALLAPIPGQGAATTAKPAAGQTSAVGSPSTTPSTPTTAEGLLAAAQSSLAALNNPATKASATGATASSTSSTTPDPDPGPRPPTLPIEFAPCAMLGVFAIARKSFEIQYEAAGNVWVFVLELIQDKPPAPAGAGVMVAPKPVSAPGVPSAAAQTAAQQQAAQVGINAIELAQKMQAIALAAAAGT